MPAIPRRQNAQAPANWPFLRILAQSRFFFADFDNNHAAVVEMNDAIALHARNIFGSRPTRELHLVYRTDDALECLPLHISCFLHLGGDRGCFFNRPWKYSCAYHGTGRFRYVRIRKACRLRWIGPVKRRPRKPHGCAVRKPWIWVTLNAQDTAYWEITPVNVSVTPIKTNNGHFCR